jgi:diguanylate cyclase (GGDEF)-like protein
VTALTDDWEAPTTETAFGYEPWLFQLMLDQLEEEKELDIGWVYSVLEKLAERYQLEDVIVNIDVKNFGAQLFRLGRRAISTDLASRLGATPGVYCNPDVVPEVERDAVRAACQLVLSLHYARYIAGTDFLTKIANEITFKAAFEAACANSARYGWAFTYVLIDIDEFKKINDTYSYSVGNDVIRRYGLAIRRSVRSGDVAARLHGDEFAVLLSNAGGHEVAGFIDRLRFNLGPLNLGPSNLGPAIENVTFSFGSATSPRESTDHDVIEDLAEDRLKEVKKKKGFTR